MRGVPKPYQSIGFVAMGVAKPYKFVGFGAMDVAKPYKFIRLGAGADFGGSRGPGRLADYIFVSPLKRPPR